MVEFEIHPSKSCLIIVDMTNAFLRPGAPLEVPNGRSLIPKLKRIVDIGRGKNLITIFTTHVFRKNDRDIGLATVFRPEMKKVSILREGTSDIEFYDELKPQKNDIVIIKRRFSAFFGTDLDLILRSNKIDTIIIGGVATNVCCACSAYDARMRDYRVIFLSDGTAAGGLPNMGWGEVSPQEVQRITLATMACYTAQVLSVEEVINQIQMVHT
jgi:nicotinamidase-related amidase